MLPFSLPHTPGKCNAFEGSSQLSSNFTWGSAQVRETAFLGSLPQTLLGKLRTNQGNCFLGEFTSNSTGEAPHKPGKLLSWGVYLKLYWGSSAQTRETAFLGNLPQTLLGKLRTNQGNCFLGEFTSSSTRKAPRKLRDKPNPSSHGHGCCVSGSGPARLLIASRPGAPLRGLNVGLCGDR